MYLYRKIVFSIVLCLFVHLGYAQTLTLTQKSPEIFCDTGIDSFKINWNNAIAGSNIVFYQSTNPAFNPYLGQGDSIGFIHIESSTTSSSSITTTCPRILGIFIDACNQPPLNEWDNEYMVITSGTGFQVSNLKIDLPANPSINIPPSSCIFSTPSAAMMTTLRVGSCNSTTLIAAGQADSIPPNAIVIIFTGNGPIYTYNFSSYCSSGQPIYILQNSCSPGNGSFVNNRPSGCPNSYRTTTIQNRSCFDALTYAPCTLPPYDSANPNANDGNYVVHLETTDTSSITNGGIKNNAADKCNGLDLDSIIGNTTITYPIPADGSANTATNFCNTGYHYIKAVTNPPGTQPVSNTIKFKLVCVDLIATPVKQSLCSGENVVINNSSTDPSATFSWNVNAGINVSGASAGNGAIINQTLTNNSTTKDSVTYTITSTDETCTSVKSIKIYVSPNPKPDITGNLSICSGVSTTLDAGAGFTTYAWTKDGVAIPGNQTINTNQAGQYVVTVTKNGCTGKDTAVVVVSSALMPDITGSLLICSGGSTSLDAGAGFDTYAWTKDGVVFPGGQIINVIQAGQYIVTVTKTGCTGKDTVNIVVSSSIKPDITGGLSVCNGSTTTLDAGAGFDSYTWNNGTLTQTNTVTTPGQYIVTVTKGSCNGKDTVTVVAGSLTFSFGGNTSVCKGQSVSLDAGSGFTTYNWNTGAVSQSINVTLPGKYWVTVTKNGCSGSDTILVSEIDKPVAFNLGNDTTICGSFSKVLSTGNAQTLWSTGVTAAQIIVTTPGKYYATLSNSCGSVSDTINIIQSGNISFSFGGNTSVCKGKSVSLDAGTGFDSYLWNTGAVTQSINVTLPGQYWAQVTKAGCTARDSIQVSEIDKPAAFNLGNDTSFCGSFSKVLTTGNPQTVWSTGVTASQITVTSAGKYYATLTNSCGSVADTIVIANASTLAINLGRDTTICSGNSLTLNATTAGSNIQYKWITGETTPTISVNQFGKYWVEVSNSSCTVSDTILVDVINPPNSFTIGNDTSYCGAFSKQLFTGDVTTVWTRNGTTIATDLSVTVMQPGTYIAKITNACGSVSDTIVLQQFALPNITLGNDTTICDSIQLTVGNGLFSSISWSTSDTSPTISVNTAGLYSVVVSNANCFKGDSIVISKECFYEVYVPTAFSPNGDGKNDIFVPLSDENGMQVLSFNVFNRWGERVYQSVNFVPGDVSQGWNGTYKNADCQVDTYVYYFTAKMPDDQVITYKGTFMLLR